MFTYNMMRGWSAVKEQVENEHAFNFYRNSMGMQDLAKLYGVKSGNNNAPAIQGKSKEYNLINREYSQCIAEVELYKQSLDNPISDMQRKIRDIDRVNPNNFEDYYQAMGTFTTLKKEQLNAIVQKASMIKNKHDLLLKITKQENESTGGGNPGAGNPATNMASIFKSLPTNNSYSEAVFKGDMDIHTAEAKTKENERISMVTSGGGYDLGRDSTDERGSMSAYAVAKTKYGDAVKETYCADKRGFGYVKYTTPEGEEGVRQTPLGLFKTQYIDYGAKSIIDSAKMMYPVEEVDSIPAEIEKEWLNIFPDGVNRLGARN